LAAGCASPNPPPISGETAIVQRDIVVSHCQEQARRDTRSNGDDWCWRQVAKFNEEVVTCMQAAGLYGADSRELREQQRRVLGE
jgi:hypothetical protein